MSDSESDTSNNVFTFQNGNTTVSAKGPNTNMSLSFRNPLMSTMYMPRNFERQRYAESAYDQRSMYYRRETSPMSNISLHSTDIRPRNFQRYYPGSCVGSQRSGLNGRTSPVSMRSVDSSASISAADIAFALNNVKYNKYDLKVIKEAYNKLMKQRVRKRIEKRRNIRLFLKNSRRRSGDDSGDQGSNSAISSDDDRSVKTYKENMSSSRSARIDLTEFRRAIRDSNMLKDCSANFRQNTSNNMFSLGSGSVNNTETYNKTQISKHSNPRSTQKDRFKNGFLLPSQRFNRSIASSLIPENSENLYKNVDNNTMNTVKNHFAQNKNNNCASGSEDEQIFSETTVRENNIETQHKRSLDSDNDSNLPAKKKSKISSPVKNAQKNNRAPSKPKNINSSNHNIENQNKFEFAKPAVPIRKLKPKVQEKLIAKSSLPLTEFLEPIPNNIQEKIQDLQSTNLLDKCYDSQTQAEQAETTQNSDISNQPSFIKRKLFTQKLDVAEKANLSSDGTNSPHSNVYSLQKEKNKARKLVTNQSCLNREVQDDNNLLDLIHKIVPLDRMNITNQSTMNQTKTDLNTKNKTNNNDKWDVTSVISMCNDDDVSDTYTDEEIFERDNSKEDTKKNKETNSKANPNTLDNRGINNRLILPDCKIVVENLQCHNLVQNQVYKQSINLPNNNLNKNNVKCSVKSFWETDYETDVECQTALPRRHKTDNLQKANAALDAAKQDLKNPAGNARNQVSNNYAPEVPKQLNNITMNNTIMNNTVESMRKFNTSTLSIKSHRTSNKKKCNETVVKETKSKSDNQNIIPIDKYNEISKEINKKSAEKTNSKNNNKSKISTPSKLNMQNDKLGNITPSTSHTRNKSPKAKQSKIDKQVENPKNNNKSESKSKPERSSKLKYKLGSQNKSSPVKNKVERPIESTKEKKYPKSNNQSDNHKNKKDAQNKSPKSKPKSKTDRHNSSIRATTNNAVSRTKSNLNNNEELDQKSALRSDRPLRSCRTSSQNRSMAFSRTLQVSDTSGNEIRSLRSRDVSLSDLSINIKGKKRVNNKNISLINTRISDVSFSLGPNKQTPTPKKSLARGKLNFFKGKRKI